MIIVTLASVTLGKFSLEYFQFLPNHLKMLYENKANELLILKKWEITYIGIRNGGIIV